MTTENQIIAYLEQQLSPIEHKAFEDRLDLQEPELLKSINDFFRIAENKTIETQFSSKRKEIDAERLALKNILDNYAPNEEEDCPIEDQVLLDYHAGFLAKIDYDIIRQILDKHPSIASYAAEQQELISLFKSFETKDPVRAKVEKFAKEFAEKSTSEGKVSDIKKDTPESAKIAKLPNRRKWLIAASIALLATAAIYFSLVNRTDHDQIFATHHQTEKTIAVDLLDEIGTVGLADPLNPKQELKKALQYYLATDYETSLNATSNYLDSNKNDSAATFLLALNYMELKQYQAAIETLQSIINNDNEWSNKATFQLAMAYLKTKDTAHLSKALFTKVSQAEGAYYQAEAKKVLLDF